MMTDDVWERDEPQSPCIKVCVVDPKSRLCMGCYRSMDEIRDWPQLGNDARIEIMKTLHEREKLVKPARKGGRAARMRQSGQ